MKCFSAFPTVFTSLLGNVTETLLSRTFSITTFIFQSRILRSWIIVAKWYAFPYATRRLSGSSTYYMKLLPTHKYLLYLVVFLVELEIDVLVEIVYSFFWNSFSSVVTRASGFLSASYINIFTFWSGTPFKQRVEDGGPKYSLMPTSLGTPLIWPGCSCFPNVVESISFLPIGAKVPSVVSSSRES